MNNKSPSKKAWQIFSIITLLFLIPILLAWLFYTHTAWLPEKSVNHGKLISPPLSIRELSLDPALLHHQWTLIYVHSGICDSICQRELYNMRQIQRALGKDMNRLQRIMLTVQPVDSQLQNLLNASETLYWQIDPAVMTRAFGHPAVFYVVDPLGNIILMYSANDNPEWMLDDLKYLMGASSIG